MDLTLIVGNIAVVYTIANNFAGLPICLDFFRKRSTSNVSVLPFLMGAVCTGLWLLYSISLGDAMLQTVNTTAVFLQTSYCFCFYVNTVHKKSTLNMLIGSSLFILLTYLYAFHVASPEVEKSLLGYLASTGSILACASPMASVKDVVNTKSTESLPFLMIFSSFIMSSLWFIYGFLVKDKFIQVPNLTCSILGLLQLSLFLVYPTKSKNSSKED